MVEERPRIRVLITRHYSLSLRHYSTVIHFVLENGILSQPASFSKICLENGPIFRCAANAAQQKTVHFPTPAFFLGLAPALIFQRLVSKTKGTGSGFLQRKQILGNASASRTVNSHVAFPHGVSGACACVRS